MSVHVPITGVELVVARALVQRRGRVLLVRRAGWDSFPCHWELPGGKVDAGEPDEAGLARELAEETGLVLSGRATLRAEQRMWSPSGRLVDERVYGVRAAGPVRLSDEHDDHLWWRPGAPLPGPLTPAAHHVLTAPAAPAVGAVTPSARRAGSPA